MVLATRSCTEDNLIARLRNQDNFARNIDDNETRLSNEWPSINGSVNGSIVSHSTCASKHTSPIIMNFTASSVGISTKSLDLAGWTRSEKVAGYVEHIVKTGAINTVPKDKHRAPGSISYALTHSFQADPKLRDEHLRSLKPAPEEKYIRAFGGGYEAVFRGAMFLRNIQEVLNMADKIYHSIYVRKHDLDESDFHAVDIFYTFLDAFLLRYYNGTDSELKKHRTVLLQFMGMFYDIRQRLRGTNGRDFLLIETLLSAMKRARHIIIRIARYEAKGGVVTMPANDSIWEDTLAGKVAYYMLTNGLSDNAEERNFKFTSILNFKKRSRTLKHHLKRVNELQKLTDGFVKAKDEYIKMFKPKA